MAIEIDQIDQATQDAYDALSERGINTKTLTNKQAFTLGFLHGRIAQQEREAQRYAFLAKECAECTAGTCALHSVKQQLCGATFQHSRSI